MSEYGKMNEQHKKENEENKRDAYSKSQENVDSKKHRYARKKGGDWLDGKNPPYINIDYNKKFSSSATYSVNKEKTYTYSQGTGSYSGSISSDGSVSISENTTSGEGTKIVKGTDSTFARACGKVIKRGTHPEVIKKEQELWKKDLKLFHEISKGKPTKSLPRAVLRLFYFFQCIFGLASILLVFLLPTIQPGVYVWEGWIKSYFSVFSSTHLIITFIIAIVFAGFTIFFAVKINRYIGCYTFFRKIPESSYYRYDKASIIRRYMEEFAQIDGVLSGEPQDYVPDYDTVENYKKKYCSRSTSPKVDFPVIITPLVFAGIILLIAMLNINEPFIVFVEYAFAIVLLILGFSLFLCGGLYIVVKCPLAKIIERDVRLRSTYASGGEYQDTLKLIDEIRSYTVR